MSIRDSESGIFESSLKNRPEMQSCKLNNSESKPNITLKKIGQELDIAETKCLTLKSELNYMMGVCREVEIKGSKGTFDTLHEQTVSSSMDPSRKSSGERHNHACNSEIADTIYPSPIAGQFSPAKAARDDEVVERSESTGPKEEEQTRLMNVTITPRAQLDDNKLPPATTTMPVRSKTAKANRAYKSLLSCYPEHLRFMLNAERFVDDLTAEADDDYFRPMSCYAKEDIAKSELDALDTKKIARTGKSKHAPRTQGDEESFVFKAGDVVSKARKRKGKLRSSISKSTVATKDTNIISRKETKKRKHRGHGVIHKPSVLPKHPKRPNDVVEIFHNTTLKSSNSGISSKHFKFNREPKYAESQRLAETDDRKTQEKAFSECIDYKSYNKENQQKNHQILDNQNNSGKNFESVQEQNKSEKYPNNSPLQYKTHQYEHSVSSRYNDPLLTRSYEMPTLSSKLKRSNKSYFSRFNFRNIPFVVGTSVTPSYNLGLNIQQVLGVMKNRQSVTNDITPSLIRKVSRGMKPVSSLLQQINGHCERSVLDFNSQIIELITDKEESCAGRDRKSPALDLQHAEETRKVHTSILKSATVISEEDRRKIKPRSSSAVNKGNAPANAKERQGMSLSKEDNIGDHKSQIAGSRNSKEIRDVLINLHDQFEEMNTRYEKLQLEVERSGDKALAKELSTLEKELNAKEEEINAVIGLYKEVMTLKQQMKTLHERNSLVCITTESSAGLHGHTCPISVIPGRSHLTNAAQIVGRRRGSAQGATREPPTSIQLAALLRQIQTFHKQLQLV